MVEKCAFCGRDPYEYVDIGVGYEKVAVTCCDLGCAVYDHRTDPDSTIEVSVAELSTIAGEVSELEWQIKRRNRLIEMLMKRRNAHRLNLSN